MNDILKKLNEVFPDCEVFESIEAVLKARETDIEPLYCNYGNPYMQKQKRYTYSGRIRVVTEELCKHHLSAFDPFCWKECQCEYSKNRLRPALSAAYQQQKNSMTGKAQSPSASGASLSSWE